MTVLNFFPPQMHAGGSVNLIITGSGFTSDMRVSFENGTGFAPVANNISVNPAGTEITGVVTVKKGGNRADPTWDVRVGPVLLPNQFTVLP